MATQTATVALPAQLDDIWHQLRAASDHAREVAGGLAPARLARRPAFNSWSVAECIAHLTLTTDAFLPLLRGALDKARSSGPFAEGPFRTDLFGRLLIWFIEPPARTRVSTQPAFVPVVTDRPERALDDFLDRQIRLQRLLPTAVGLALDRIRITSPFERRVGYSVISALLVIPAHQRRHLWQAERARRAIEEAAS